MVADFLRVQQGKKTFVVFTAASLAISGGANPKAVHTMLGHQSAALTLDTYADLFADDLDLVSATLDQTRQVALAATADQLRTGTEHDAELDIDPTTSLSDAHQIAHDAEHTLTHAVPKLSTALIHAYPAHNGTPTKPSARL